MNATTQAIIDRLPKKPLLTPQEIAGAFALQTPHAILQDIACGRLAAAKMGARYIVSAAEARRYIASKAVIPTEGTLPDE